jgi:hypothetical protein
MIATFSSLIFIIAILIIIIFKIKIKKWKNSLSTWIYNHLEASQSNNNSLPPGQQQQQQPMIPLEGIGNLDEISL